tara:strand:+ start:323 stop:532 length:210 start_codon:yes stop_codon:yes gene_type:complete
MINPVTHLKERLRMTQTELGEAVGIPQSSIAQYETGHCNPSAKRMIALLSLAKKNRIKLDATDLMKIRK